MAVITNRGVKVWPDGHAETFCTDHWRCRFFGHSSGNVAPEHLVTLTSRLVEAGLPPIKTENLYRFDGQISYAAVQGQ